MWWSTTSGVRKMGRDESTESGGMSLPGIGHAISSLLFDAALAALVNHMASSGSDSLWCSDGTVRPALLRLRCSASRNFLPAARAFALGEPGWSPPTVVNVPPELLLSERLYGARGVLGLVGTSLLPLLALLLSLFGR